MKKMLYLLLCLLLASCAANHIDLTEQTEINAALTAFIYKYQLNGNYLILKKIMPAEVVLINGDLVQVKSNLVFLTYHPPLKLYRNYFFHLDPALNIYITFQKNNHWHMVMVAKK